MYSTNIAPADIHQFLEKHILADGLDFTLDLEKSNGCYLYDSTNNREILDFFNFFSTAPLGHNHPALFKDEEFKKNLLTAAISNPSNSDFYTTQYATFIETFARVAKPENFKYSFFISGGALAVANALKVAMDWKVQKNMKKGLKEEKGHQVIHFQQAFHGRSGYTLSITDTSDDKTRYFKKFDWPRILNPKITFPIEDHLDEVIKLEQKAVEQVKQAFADNQDDICCIIIEPVQSEGGDNHFRPEFFKELRILADENEAMLIFDEVQTGVGLTGKFWGYENYGVEPDLIAFGKKMQVCGIMSTARVDEIPENCFHVNSRINSTWGGSLTDMVRSTKFLEVIESDNLVENASIQGNYLLSKLHQLAEKHSLTNVRGVGLLCAFDLPSTDIRNNVIDKALEKNLLLLGCGDQSIRFRPPLIVSKDVIDEGMDILHKTLQENL
ncbi:MAG: L-lysine 6-transaminase [Bacteroidetes bacterium]|nr:L-lysine 6-transaminase [Bacteroidota bacterium]